MDNNEISWQNLEERSKQSTQIFNRKESAILSEIKDYNPVHLTFAQRKKMNEVFKKISKERFSKIGIIDQFIIVRKNYTWSWVEGVIDFSDQKPKMIVRTGLSSLAWIFAILILTLNSLEYLSMIFYCFLIPNNKGICFEFLGMLIIPFSPIAYHFGRKNINLSTMRDELNSYVNV
ncbi:MAG: hypothetical protein QXO35_03880 [Candidatus Micrarchaeia archaeon]